MARWISEWQCAGCQRKAWGKGKGPKPQPKFTMMYRAVLCRACKRPMVATGKAIKVYTTAELL